MIVKHYKGGIYQVIAETKVASGYIDCTQMIVAQHTETGFPVVAKLDKDNYVYTQDEEFVFYIDEDNRIWARPRPMFWEQGYFNNPDVIEPRFVIIEGAKVGE